MFAAQKTEVVFHAFLSVKRGDGSPHRASLEGWATKETKAWRGRDVLPIEGGVFFKLDSWGDAPSFHVLAIGQKGDSASKIEGKRIEGKRIEGKRIEGKRLNAKRMEVKRVLNSTEFDLF
jgi:hypothetical protein